MRTQTRNPHTAAGVRTHDAVEVDKPPDLAGMFLRLGVLLVTALGFGLAAELLVGVPH
jgi:hypothetical protein